MQTHDGLPLSGVCAALTNTPRAERLLQWIDSSYIVQDHAVATAEEIVQVEVLSLESDSRPSTHPAYAIVYNDFHMLIANDDVPQYIASPGILCSSPTYQPPFGDWARATLSPKHSAGVTGLVHGIAAISIHHPVHLAEANPGGPVSVSGHMGQ